MKHAYSLKNANRVFLISILSLMFIAASSQTNFGGLGANDSGGSGFKTIGESANCQVVSNDLGAGPGSLIQVISTWKMGNSFTACDNGIISKVKVLVLNNFNNITLEIYEGNGTSGTKIGEKTGISLHNALTFTDYSVIDLSDLNIAVTSGDQYTFWFPTGVKIYIRTASMYEGGTYWVDDQDHGGIIEIDTRDLYFEVEFTDAPAASTPTLSTQVVSNFTATSATMGGSVTNDGGAAVTERGVVYSPTDATPTIGEGSVTKDVNGSGTGSFSESISSLTPNTTYYVQAYATNSAGTSYGGVESFTTSFANLTWDGSTNSDWNTADNWDGGTIPTSAYNVTIPIVATSYPAISPGDNAICNNLTVAASASLTIESGGSLITNGTITNNGSITMQRAMDDGKWHLISMPCTGITANTFLGDYLQYWTEDGQSWADIVEPTSQELSIMQGYSLWGTAKGSYSFSGTPNTGSQSISLSYHENLDPEKTADGLNLVGNPYPSSIDWATLQPTYGTAYVWNPATSNYIYNTDADIAPIQGFFVYTTNNGSSFALENANRSHGGSFYKNSSQLTHGIVLAASYKNHFDELKILFDNNAADGFNLIDDSWKLISSGAGVSQIWTYSPDGKLAIDKRPETELIQLGFANNEAGSYTIGIKEIADLNTAILEDSKLNIFHDLRQGDYSFTWSLNDAETRFKLHFNTTAVDEISSNMLQAYVSGNEIIIKSEVQADRIILTDITGRTLGVWENAEQIPAPETAGVYLVTVESENQQITKKIIIQ